MLVNMFQLAMDSLQNPTEESPHEPVSPPFQERLAEGQQWSCTLKETDSTLASFIMMLDILAKQVRRCGLGFSELGWVR